MMLLVVFSLGCRRIPSAQSLAVRESHAVEHISSGWTTHLTNRQGQVITKKMLLDPREVSSDPTKPPFIAPPPGAKAYYGFPLVRETMIDGFTLGVVTDYLERDSPAGCSIGDAFVEAPDGTRAGIVWEVDDQQAHFYKIEDPDAKRWGVYYFTVPTAVTTLDDLKAHFRLMLPVIKGLYGKHRQTTPYARDGGGG